MERREFVSCLGCAGILPALWTGTHVIDRPIQIRYWVSPRAARIADHEGLLPYVETALEPVFSSIDVSYGGIVPVSKEDGYEVMRSGEWPLRMLTDSGTADGPVPDANLLLTDGPMGPDPPGFARGPFASLGGASHLATVPDRNAVDDIVNYDLTMYTIQIFLHELGHTLGLAHDHGSILPASDGHVASPMVSGYAWQPPSDQFSSDHSHCGMVYPDSVDGNRYLSLTFSSCAQDHLRSYRPTR